MIPVPTTANSIAFSNHGISLNGTLILPSEQSPCPVLVVAHASNGGRRDYGPYQQLQTFLPEAGIGVLVFDRRGSGDSGGDFPSASFDDLASDLLAAVDFLKTVTSINLSQIGLWGLSQGGWLASLATSRSNDVAFLIAVSAAAVSPAEQMNYSAEFALREAGFGEEEVTRMLHVRRRVDDYYRGRLPFPRAAEEVDWASRQPWFSLAYLDNDLPTRPGETKWFLEMDFDPLASIRHVAVPTLLLHGEVDPWIPVEQSRSIWIENAREGLVTASRIKDANHFMVSIANSGLRADEGEIVPLYLHELISWLTRQTGQS